MKFLFFLNIDIIAGAYIDCFKEGVGASMQMFPTFLKGGGGIAES